MTNEFYSRMQRYIINSSIDMSVLRGRPGGTLEAAQNSLNDVDLAEFANPASFRRVLNNKTEALHCGAICCWT
jgi:hypothetical protein